MKKFFLFATACAVIMSCSKDNSQSSEPEVPVEPEEPVYYLTSGVDTYSYSNFENAATKLSTKGKQFQWDVGDSLLVTSSEESTNSLLRYIFHFDAVTSWDYPENARLWKKGLFFHKGVIEQKNTYNVQYPASTPDLRRQYYLEGGLPSGTMLCTGTITQTQLTKDGSTSVNLIPQYAGFCLGLGVGTGGSTQHRVDSLSLVTTNNGYKKTYKLTDIKDNLPSRWGLDMYLTVIPGDTLSSVLVYITHEGTGERIEKTFTMKKGKVGLFRKGVIAFMDRTMDD